MAGGGINTLQSRYCGNFISTLAFGGLATGPEYRRQGFIRRLIEDTFALAPEGLGCKHAAPVCLFVLPDVRL